MSRYEPLPSSDPNDESPSSAFPHQNGVTPHTAPDPDRPLRASVQREFNREPTPTWKRLLVLLFIVGMGYFSWRITRPVKPQVIYAQRYSDEFKYRPAASPVITETLKDGRIRIRGASIGGQGVREEDVPKLPHQIEYEKKKAKEDAKKRAKEKLRESREKAKKRGKERSKGRKMKVDF